MQAEPAESVPGQQGEPADVPGRTAVVHLVVVALAAALFGGVVATSLQSEARVSEVVEGWVPGGEHRIRLPLHHSPVQDGDLEFSDFDRDFFLAAAPWRMDDGSWQHGQPATCISTDPSDMTRVRMGVVQLRGEHGLWQHVAWLECLEKQTGIDQEG